jgi:hypothetical protein
MKKSEMICALCDYYVLIESLMKRKEAAIRGECRRRPPSVVQTEVLEVSSEPVFEDTVSLRAPLRRMVVQPVFPPVNPDCWCGDGRWSAQGGGQVFWGQWESDDE